MEAKDDFKHGVFLDSTYNFKDNSNVTDHLIESRSLIQTRLQKCFENLPERKSKYLILDQYIKDNPQSVIFVPNKDLNMFPIVINEAKTLVKKYIIKDKLDQIMNHEFEHIQKAYELGVDFKGMGLVLFKQNGKPSFGGFVSISNDQEVSLINGLRIYLAPKTLFRHNTGDYLKSELLVIKALTKVKTFEEINKVMSDTIFVIKERYLPKGIHSIFK